MSPQVAHHTGITIYRSAQAGTMHECSMLPGFRKTTKHLRRAGSEIPEGF